MAILNNIPFGLAANVADFSITESASMTNRSDKIETVGQTGNIKSVTYYNANGEFTATGLKVGTPSCTVTTFIAIGETGSDSAGALKAGFTGAGGATGGAATGALVLVTELTIEQSNEDFERYTVKGQFWKNITS